jgi:hypothetical protein
MKLFFLYAFIPLLTGLNLITSIGKWKTKNGRLKMSVTYDARRLFQKLPLLKTKEGLKI